ncbi:NAD(P)/FAD-dependent oxidoreductase [Mucilaginibacter roseus]|uniref:NADH:ubiquinone reductase (non-electrogenic) n=1 Tax=Mucilaginibacter roseus TaxID=1528868 RepID=A0ABS8TZ10_9SPHI|nr:NAD(P)/FAD-dependent oxidoreductase [Mucilaginibacter roseus]MCD8739025.1 NAD(P)/FAD-dependent oxidoreductase [Mucilaginibacter roseus]
MSKMNNAYKEVVIIGGGFAGVNLAKSLADEDGIHVTLVDKNNYNFFPPLLYQVATGFLEVSNITYPFRKMFARKKNIRFRMAELIEIDAEHNTVILNNGKLIYDYLVLATGTESNYFGIDNIKRSALTMKTIDDAVNIRNFFLLQAERATLQSDPVERAKLSNIVIAGGGPTGVELAGMIAQTRKKVQEAEYPELKGEHPAIYLVDALDVVLAPMSEKSQRYTKDTLINMGVNVMLGKQVKDYIHDAVIFSDGSSIPTKSLIWTAGVMARTFAGLPESSYGRGNRLRVDAYNAVIGLRNIYAIGDTCIQTTDPDFGNGHPQLAQVAIQQGKNLAANLKAMQSDAKTKPFSYNDKGSMAIIGRYKAVAEIPRPKFFFRGFLAWSAWLFVHLFSLVSFQNKIKTIHNWFISFLTNDQSMRIIERPK